MRQVQRLCQCNTGQIQTEHHVLIECSRGDQLRQKFPGLNFEDLKMLWKDEKHVLDVCRYIYEFKKIHKE